MVSALSLLALLVTLTHATLTSQMNHPYESVDSFRAEYRPRPIISPRSERDLNAISYHHTFVRVWWGKEVRSEDTDRYLQVTAALASFFVVTLFLPGLWIRLMRMKVSYGSLKRIVKAKLLH